MVAFLPFFAFTVPSFERSRLTDLMLLMVGAEYPPNPPMWNRNLRFPVGSSGAALDVPSILKKIYPLFQLQYMPLSIELDGSSTPFLLSIGIVFLRLSTPIINVTLLYSPGGT